MYPRQDIKSGLYGYWGQNEWAIRPQFSYGHAFYRGYAAIRQRDGRPGLITIDGTHIPLEAICGGRKPCNYQDFSFIGFNGLDSVPPEYAIVRVEEDDRLGWGLIDANLNYRPLPSAIFANATTVLPCISHLVIYEPRRNNEGPFCGLFNLGDDRLELPVEYSSISPSAESMWAVSKAVGRGIIEHQHVFYNIHTRDLIPERYAWASPFSCGFGAVRLEDSDSEGRSFFVNENLQPAFDADFDDVDRFSFGLAAVYDGEDAGYIDAAGRMRLLLPYDRMMPFNRYGLALANRDETRWDIDIIDRYGKPKLSHLETAVFMDGDFPYFDVTLHGEKHLYSSDVELIY